MKLLTLLYPNFNDIEFNNIICVLKASGQFEEIAFFHPTLKIVSGQFGISSIETKNLIDFKDFDAVFIPGGSGAKELRKDKSLLEIIKVFKENNKYIFAICDAPNVLIENNIIDQEEYSSYPIENLICSKNRNEKAFTFNNKIFTAKAAGYALDFGLNIIRNLFGENLYKQMSMGLYGGPR